MTLVPLGAAAALARRRWVAVAFLAPFLLMYAAYPFFLDHYLVPAMPAIVLLALAGWDALAANLSSLERPARVIGALAILALTLTALPQFQRDADPDEWDQARTLRQYDAAVAKVADRPSIVLFRFDEKAATALDELAREKEEAKADAPAAVEVATSSAATAASAAPVVGVAAAAHAGLTASTFAFAALPDDERSAGLSVHAEPVYNPDVARVDDARVIRAHDRGPDEDRKLFAYYARVAPDRRVYLYDRAVPDPDQAMTYLGTARELAERGAPRSIAP
jgi:hypothetical protein